MSIVRLKKLTFCGMASDREQILQRIQELGCVHLLPLKATPENIENATSSTPNEAYKALKFLTASADRRTQLPLGTPFDMDVAIQDVLKVKNRLRRMLDKRAFLQKRISIVRPWGELFLSPDSVPGGFRLWFYELPLRKRGTLNDLKFPWEIVGQDHKTAYVAIISETEPEEDILPVPRTHIGDKPLSVLRAELVQTEIDLDDVAADRVALTRFIRLITANMFEAENTASLEHAGEMSFDDGDLFAVQGWAPHDRLGDLNKLASQFGLAMLEEDVAPDDHPPTLLDQPEARAASADLAFFYQVPGYRDWDPTVLILVSFALFFGMIMSDAGYGIVMLFGLALFWRKLGSSKPAKAYRRLGVWLTLSTIIYGMLVGSYFGVAPDPSSLLGAVKILSPDDFDTMMKISVGVGVLHIGFANLMSAWTHRNNVYAISRLGWIAFSLGGLGYWLGFGDPSAQSIAIFAIAIGVAAIVLFSSQRPARSFGDYLFRLLDGGQALAGIMGAFGDVLSYMRLFALGLASASLAMTFNDLAGSAYEALPGLGVLAAGLILLVGHALNFVLAVMSGAVHGLRLNFIEFFKWGLNDEGYAFQSFARKEVQS